MHRRSSGASCGPDEGSVWAQAQFLLENFGPQIASVINTVVPAKFSTPGPENVAATHVLAGGAHMTARVRGLDFLVSPASFFQVSCGLCPGHTR